MYHNVKKGLFTNVCKKTLKLVQLVLKIILEKKVLVEELSDTFVMIVIPLLVLKEDLNNYKKLYSKSMSIKDKF